MKIGMTVWSLYHTQGGIQRLGVNLANAMQQRGHDMVLFYRKEPYRMPEPIYPLNSGIKTVELTLSNKQTTHKAKKIIQDQNIDLLCAMFSWNELLWFPALLNTTGIPFLISEHSNPQIIEDERWNRYERLACMAGADAIHMLSKAFVSSLPEFLHPRVTVIGNPAPVPQTVDWSREDAPRKRLLAAGRLVDELKQFSLLIQAFALLANQFPEWDLHICGEGQDFQFYAEMIARLNLSSRITLMGKVDDMDKHYASSHIFCMPSRYEGFGLVTVEAQSHALPVVGFSGCSGTNEIVLHGKSGILASEMNAISLSVCLRTLMKNSSLRKKMGTMGQELLGRYGEKKIYDRWEELFSKTALHKNKTQLQFSPASVKERTELALREIITRVEPFIRTI